MRKVIFLAAVVAFVSLSFTTHSKLNPLEKQHTKVAGGKSWKTAETTVYYDLLLFTCTGDVVYFPQYTIEVDLHGVENGNQSMVQGEVLTKGTGYSIVNGLEYTMNDALRYHNKLPIVNGATILKTKFAGMLTSAQGSKELLSYKVFLTINANGEVTSENIDFSSACQ